MLASTCANSKLENLSAFRFRFESLAKTLPYCASSRTNSSRPYANSQMLRACATTGVSQP